MALALQMQASLDSARGLCVETTSNGSTVQYPLPNPDINGVGVRLLRFTPTQVQVCSWRLSTDFRAKVFLGFMVAAYVSWILVACYYAAGCVPEHLLNRFDRTCMGVRVRPRVTDKILEDVTREVSYFADQQLITAIGLLGAGFLHMRETMLFDWHTIVYLASLSSNIASQVSDIRLGNLARTPVKIPR